METNSQKSEAIIQRRRKGQFFKVLLLVTLETIVAALFLIWSEEVLDFLRSGINWPCAQNQSLLITAILTNICNFLVIYGLANRKMPYLIIGALQHCLTGIYFAAAGLYYCSLGLYYLKDITKEGPPIMVLIGMGYWFVFAMEDILKHVENMENDPKSMSDTQIV